MNLLLFFFDSEFTIEWISELAAIWGRVSSKKRIIMKFEKNRLPRNASLEEIKSEIIRVAGLIPETIITKVKFRKLSKISTDTILRKFDSWENALKSCELGHRYSYNGQRKFSDTEMLEELKRVSKLIGMQKLSSTEFNKISKINMSVICKHLGGWTKALKLAGLEPERKYHSELEYYENLLNVWKYYEREPFPSEMKKPPSVIDSNAYKTHWGSWGKLYLLL